MKSEINIFCIPILERTDHAMSHDPCLCVAATVTDSAEMVLFKLASSACSRLSCGGAVGVFWGGKPRTSWKMGCM